MNPRGSKVQSVVTHMKQKLLENFMPFSDTAVDESTIGFKGCVAFKMYNPQKPTKWGILIYVLADCATGYICCFEPYYVSLRTV